MRFSACSTGVFMLVYQRCRLYVMLEARNICLEVEAEDEPLFLLNDISFCIPRGHFMAIVGPSGCGKTTLLKSIAGIKEITSGSFVWEGRDLADDGDFEPHEIGYVPQFSIAYDELTVDESIESSARLRVNADEDELNDIIDNVLEETGLTDIADRPVKLLSGGQKRRLALAMELVSGPRILLCDEVTSGLDPRSEREIVELLHELSMKDGRIVISVTHSLAQMELYDSIMVLHRGTLTFHGTPAVMSHYFSVNNFEEVYPRLTCREPEEWSRSWLKHRVDYYKRLEKEHVRKFLERGEEPPAPLPAKDDDEEESQTVTPPGFFTQFSTLLGRRFNIFFRDRAQLILQIAMIVIFPLLVACFADADWGKLTNLNDMASQNLSPGEMEKAIKEQANLNIGIGTAISGVIMFQVILLGLMGSNNSAREVAGERLIMEKEKFSGVRPAAYVCSKLAFLSILVLVQSFWMFFFVDTCCWSFKGSSLDLFLYLLLANAAMTSICLGISANTKSADHASLLSIYLVGFQLPLSGVLLALDDVLAMVTQPFISAYWAWSGGMRAVQADYRDVAANIVQTQFAAADICMMVLGAHIVVGLVLAYIGVCRTRWE